MTASSSYFALLRRNRAFRRLWLAELTSLIGDWFNTIALYTAIDGLLGTTQAVGWVVVAKSLPFLVVSPIAGPLVDSLPRRALMIGSDLARAVLVLLLLVAWHLESVAGLYLCTVLSIAASGLFLPAKTASIPSLVGRDEIGAANAISGATWSVSLAAGAALGGFATQAFGVTGAFLLDAATFIVSALLLRGLPALEPEGDRSAGGAGFVAGLRYLFGQRRLLPVLGAKSGMAFTTGVVPLLTVYGNRVLADQPTPWIVGVLFAARGVGAATGSLFGRRVFGDSPVALQTATLAGFVALVLAYLWLAVAGSLWTCALAAVLGGVGNALVWVSSTTLLQREVAPAFLGRTFSVDFGAMTMVGAVAILGVTGLVDAAVLTPRGGVALSGLLAIPPAIALLIGTLLLRRGWR